MLVNIYQLPEEHNNVFLPFRLVHNIKISDYTLVYTCKRTSSTSLDDLFREFNRDQPKDYNAHSLSVGDIVQLNNRFYFCDSCGWKELDLCFSH